MFNHELDSTQSCYHYLSNSPESERKHEFDADTHKTLFLGEDFDEEKERKDERSYGTRGSYNTVI